MSARFAPGCVCYPIAMVIAMLAWPAMVDQAAAEASNPVAIRKADGPQAVVAKWLALVAAGKLDEANRLTTNDSDLNAADDLARMKTRGDLRVQRSLGNKSVMVVTTNTVKRNSGKDVTFAFWLAQQDGTWRITTSYGDDPEKVDEQLRGFLLAGNAKWQPTREDVVGHWLAGPCVVPGIRGIVCGSRMKLLPNGKYTRQVWGPVGPDDADEIEAGEWKLHQDKIIMQLGEQQVDSRIVWIGPGSLVVRGLKEPVGDGKSGARYFRENNPAAGR